MQPATADLQSLGMRIAQPPAVATLDRHIEIDAKGLPDLPGSDTSLKRIGGCTPELCEPVITYEHT